MTEFKKLGSCRDSKGFTLIEALVALLVLSFGLLGVAAMQLKSLQGAHVGYQRALASLIAIDAQERVWKMISASSDKACPQASDIDESSVFIVEWVENWEGILDIDGSSVERETVADSSCIYNVVVNWEEGRFSDEGISSSFQYSFRVPVVDVPIAAGG